MLMSVFTVRDSASQLFGRPFYCINMGHAHRGFSDQVNTPVLDGQQNDLFAHPDDFELFELGTFDDATGLFVLHEAPRSVCTAKSVKKQSS